MNFFPGYYFIKLQIRRPKKKKESQCTRDSVCGPTFERAWEGELGAQAGVRNDQSGRVRWLRISIAQNDDTSPIPVGTSGSAWMDGWLLTTTNNDRKRHTGLFSSSSSIVVFISAQEKSRCRDSNRRTRIRSRRSGTSPADQFQRFSAGIVSLFSFSFTCNCCYGRSVSSIVVWCVCPSVVGDSMYWRIVWLRWLRRVLLATEFPDSEPRESVRVVSAFCILVRWFCWAIWWWMQILVEFVCVCRQVGREAEAIIWCFENMTTPS